MPFSCENDVCVFTYERSFKFCPTCGTRQFQTTGDFVESAQSEQKKRVLRKPDLKSPKVLFISALFAGLLLMVPITLSATSEGAGLAAGSTLAPESETGFAPVGSIQIRAIAWKGEEDDNYKGRTQAGNICYFGTDGNPYPDISTGTEVTLRDSSGSLVGITRLQYGRMQSGWTAGAEDVYYNDNFKYDYCVWDFKFDKIDSNDDYFTIEIGRRGENSYTRSELSYGVFLKLGD